MLFPFKKSPLSLAIYATSTALFCSASGASAQPANPNSAATEPAQLEETLVWGTTVRASSVDLGEEAIAIRQVDHLSDLLRFIPGVDVGGAHSLNQRITIRSLDDKDLRISVDGANQNTYMFHHMGNLQIHTDILQSADIEVGNNSVINGGLGGVARFETRSAKDLLADDSRYGSRLNATVGSNSSTNISVSGYGQLTNKIDVLAYINHVDRENYAVGGGEIKDSQGYIIANTDGKVRGLEGKLVDALIKFGADITEHQRIKVGYEAYSDKGDYSPRPDMGIATDMAIAGGNTVLLPTEFTRDTVTVNYEGDWDNHAVSVAVYNNISTLDRNELGQSRNRAIFSQTGEATNSGVNVLGRFTLGNNISHQLTYGLDVVQYDTEYAAYSEDNTLLLSAREQASSAAVFVQDTIQLSDSFHVIPGVRFETWDIESNLIDDRFSEPTMALALEYQPHNAIKISLSATELFKGPELSEVFTGAGSGDVYNSDIDAETGLNTEFSLAYSGDNLSAGFTYFDTTIENYIYDYINYTLSDAPFPKDNIGDLGLNGIEAYLGYSFSQLELLFTYATVDSELEAFEQYTYMDYRVKDRAGNPILDDSGNEQIVNQEGFDGARTDRTQGDSFSLSADYFVAKTDMHIHYDVIHTNSLAAGKDLDGASFDNSKDRYTVHNISVRWTPSAFAEGLALTAGIDNIFDEYYASQASRTGVSFHPVFGELFLTDYEPGRNIKASVSYQF